MRNKRKKLKNKLLKRLQLLMSKKTLSDKDREEISMILEKLDKKPGSKIESDKMNNSKQDQVAVAIYKGDSDLSNLNEGHVQSASGIYRRGRIDNVKS
tara:strand:+ start:228 stop:521 length:294 start_codon:yes stop_codon:yes gene_type:complete